MFDNNKKLLNLFENIYQKNKKNYIHTFETNTYLIFIHTIICMLSTKYISKNACDQLVSIINVCYFVQLMKNIINFLCVISITINFILLLHFYSFIYTIYNTFYRISI